MLFFIDILFYIGVLVAQFKTYVCLRDAIKNKFATFHQLIV